MTVLREKPMMEFTRMPTQRSHLTAWALGIAGVVAAAVGAWVYFVPATWFLGGLVEGWPFALFIGAGLLLTAAFGLFARMTFVDDPKWTYRVMVPTALALAALAGAITFAVILII
jgi:hypothetical protein